ncbi:uncharacterized protein DNG_06078 [Cephalotrichum gorgonifer]|uniref:Velvet domain-containing protein n=1 Tax=Cephalotrichum gorgonifer TaxID=2041049 RepID=A0AAE8MZA5_9PEZI|nr:uncharacterized protein DNG_06078 [Cephalotrichum gorgonifer]
MTALMKPTALKDAAPVTIDRKTKEGRSLRYQLTVLQQPERARACGSGSKSAADRRPVDPPPVVELRILELGPNNEMKDITFHYNANFFLFATLELARPMAHGRVQTPAAVGTPVLTGMPVSGMAYLDRPSEAGYFLFPDLSVRHEGRYKLSFNLYEETKEEKDFDEEPSEPKYTPITNPSFDWRMEIKSVAFTVFSAKKFPGLSESTALSRTVAEQGCRVRIRRDVRMRRRDGKPSSAADYNAEEEYSRGAAAPTPERQQAPHEYRRSSSAASDRDRIQRRPSIAESYHQPPAPPAPPGYSQSSGGSHHLGFGNAPPHPHPPQYHNAQPPPISPTTAAYPSSSPYQAPQSQGYGYSSRPPSQPYSSTKSSFDERRLSNSSHTAQSPRYGLKSDSKLEVDVRPDHRMSQGGYGSASQVPRSPVRPDAHAQADLRLPPLADLLNRPPSFDKMPGLMGDHKDLHKHKIEADTDTEREEPPVATGSKRPLDDSAYSYAQPLHNGARPKYNERKTLHERQVDAALAYQVDADYRRYDGLRFIDAAGNERRFEENNYVLER